ncbi:MAG TPA: TolC family protein [Bacteroidia bacterium]|nr:TolC family protein [Bacteroidia bacterium]
MKISALIFTVCFSVFNASAQSDLIDLLKTIESNNKSIQTNKTFWEARNAEFKTGLTPYDPQVEYDYLLGSPAGAGNQRDFAVTQRLDFPTTYKRKKDLSIQQIAKTEYEQQVYRQDILLEAKLLILQAIYLNKKMTALNTRLIATTQLVKDYQKKADKGDVIILDLNKARLQLLNIQNEVALTSNEILNIQTRLAELNGGIQIEIRDTNYPLTPLIPDFETLDKTIETNDPVLKVYEQEIKVRQQQIAVQKSLNLPKIEVGYHAQGILGQSYKGGHAGLTIPLWENRNRLNAARLNVDHSKSLAQTHILQHKAENKTYYDQLAVRAKAIEEYKSLLSGLNNAYLLNKSLRLGQINIIQFFQEESYYFSAFDKYLQMELEYHQAIARLYKFEL